MHKCGMLRANMISGLPPGTDKHGERLMKSTINLLQQNLQGNIVEKLS